MILLVVKDDKCFFGWGLYFLEKMFLVLVGFVELGESIEEVVVREVKEEVGIDVGEVEYYLI